MERSLLSELSLISAPTINLVDYLGNNYAPRESPDVYLLRDAYMKANKEYVEAVLRKESPERIKEFDNIRIKSYDALTETENSENINSFLNSEFLIATNLRVCTQQQIDFITASLPRPNISSFLMKYIKSMMSKNIPAISCLLETMKYSKIGNNELEYYLLHRWLRKAKIIGEESAESTVFGLYNDDEGNLFVLKTAKDQDADNIAHEAIIGMLALNLINDKVPNFTYTYGVIDCRSPTIYIDYEAKICPSYAEADGQNNLTLNVLIENIPKADTLENLIDEIDVADFLEIYLQIINALNVAYKATQFTHYDLHLGNVLIQKLKEKITIPIYLEGKTKYLHTNYLAKIIDYGQSYAKIQGYDICSYFGPVGKFIEKSYEINDVYTYLFYTGLVCNFSFFPNPKIRNILNIVEYIYQNFFKELKSFKDRLEAPRGEESLEFGQPIYDLHHLHLSDLLTFVTTIYEKTSSGLLDELPPSSVNKSEDIFVALANDISTVDNIIDYAISVNAIYKLPDSREKVLLFQKIKNVDVIKLFNNEVDNIKEEITNNRLIDVLIDTRLWTVAAHYALQYRKIDNKELYEKILEISNLTK